MNSSKHNEGTNMKTTTFLFKVLCMALTAVLLLPAMSCAKTPDNGDNTTPEDTTAADTTQVPETTIADTTEAPDAIFADAAACRAATESVENIELMLGMWVTPRPHLMTTQEDADARFAEIKEAGINMVYSFGESGDAALMDRMLKAAEKNGVKVMIELGRVADASTIEANLALVNQTKDYPAVLGYNMYDEPNVSVYALLGQQYAKIREIVSDDMLVMCNLFPNYAKDSQLGISSGKDGMTTYQVYLDRFMSEVKSDILSFDHYPFSASDTQDQNKIKQMLKNFSDIALCAQKYDVPAWGFVQNSSWDGMRIPNDDELRWLSHFHLIFGLDSYSYFLYAQPYNFVSNEGVFEGMLTYDGERTEIYDRVKANNESLAGMKGRYLAYDFKGFNVSKMSSGYKSSISKELYLENFGPLVGVDGTHNVLVGCFENEETVAYYVMNFNYRFENTAILDFGEGADFTVWGADGVQSMGTAKKLEINLLPGEGKFIEMKKYN